MGANMTAEVAAIMTGIHFLVCPGCGCIVGINDQWMVAAITEVWKNFHIAFRPVDLFSWLAAHNCMISNGIYDRQHAPDCEYHTAEWKRTNSKIEN